MFYSSEKVSKKMYKFHNLLKKHTNLQKCTKNAQIRQVVYFENSS